MLRPLTNSQRFSDEALLVQCPLLVCYRAELAGVEIFGGGGRDDTAAWKYLEASVLRSVAYVECPETMRRICV